MPDINMVELGRQLKADKPSSIYLIWGAETYLKQKAVDRLIAHCVEPDTADMNYSRIVSCSEVDTLIGMMMQYPFLSDRKCILVEDIDVVAIGEREIKQLIAAFEDMAPGCVLIFWQNDISGYEKQKAFTILLDAVRKKGSVLKFDALKYADLTKAVLEMANEQGVKMTASEANYLVERVGSALVNISSELEKLSLYCGKKAVTKEAIELVCPLSLDANVFRISQNILAGKSDEAYAIIESLLSQKTEPIEIFTRLCDNFIDLARAKAGESAGMSFHETASMFGTEYRGKEFNMKNAYANNYKCSTALIRKYIILLFECERKMKTAGTNRAVCLEKLVAELCLAGAKGR